MVGGWFPLWRQYLKHEFWNERRAWTRNEAWVWLLLSAAFEEHPVIWDGQKVILNRGQQLTSERALAHQFRWSHKRARSFVEYLEREQMISWSALAQECGSYRLLTIKNYERFRVPGHTRGTPRAHLGHTTEEGREGKQTTTPLPPKGGQLGLPRVLVEVRPRRRKTRALPFDPNQGLHVSALSDLPNGGWSEKPCDRCQGRLTLADEREHGSVCYQCRSTGATSVG